MIVCPKCGMRIEGRMGLNQNFCPNCGQKLYDESENKGDNPPKENTVQSYNLFSAYCSMFKKYAQFNGRSRRSEYWYATLANAIIVFLIYFIMTPSIMEIIKTGTVSDSEALALGGASIIMTLYLMATIVPGIALGVRRLHDTGRSGWYMLLVLIPYIGSIILVVFMAQDGQHCVNQYGTDPKSLL